MAWPFMVGDFFEPVVVPEPVCPVLGWTVPGCAVPGMALPAGGPTEGEGELGWESEGVGCGLVVVPGVLDPGADPGALVPEPVVCATPGPASSVVNPAIAKGVNHR